MLLNYFNCYTLIYMNQLHIVLHFSMLNYIVQKHNLRLQLP